MKLSERPHATSAMFRQLTGVVGRTVAKLVWKRLEFRNEYSSRCS
jgi:hypothetical protein